MKIVEKLIFEVSKPGRKAYSLPANDVEETALNEILPQEMLRSVEPDLPEVSEVDVVRHFTALSELNYGVDSGFYPLGSCTMKYNPKVNENIARLEGFTNIHPYQDTSTVQGALQIMHELDEMLSEITGMAQFSLQPAAGAHGEMTGLMIIKAYHEHNQESHRNKIIVPDSAHGTNPASATVLGYETIEVKSNERGGVDVDALRELMSDDIAGLMLTNPNTLGLFEEDILEMAEIVHEAGGLLYYDGANANAILGVSRPGDMGFDVIHLNLHKTFSSPHGGGGPGSGPVGVCQKLTPFLPTPMVKKENGSYVFDEDRPLTIGKVRSYYANFGVILRAYAYIKTMGPEGLRQVAEMAVLNANYMMHQLKGDYHLPFDRICMHEFVLSGSKQKEEHGVTTLDIAKRLIDYGFHPPTVYFPLVVKEAIMVEPTETESKEVLDSFIEVMKKIADEAKQNKEIVVSAPHETVVSRLDEARAARNPVVTWKR